MSVGDSFLGCKLWVFGLCRTLTTRWLRIVSSALGLAVAVSALMGVGLAGTAAVRSFENSIGSDLSNRAQLQVKKIDSEAANFSASDIAFLESYGAVAPMAEFPVVARGAEDPSELLELPITVTDTAAFTPASPMELFASAAVISALPKDFVHKPSLFIDGHSVSFSKIVEIPKQFGASFSLYADLSHPALSWVEYSRMSLNPFNSNNSLENELASAGFLVQRMDAANSSATESGSMLAAFSLNIAVMAILTAVVALALLLIASIRMAEERRHDALVLRAFGAGPTLIASLLFSEAFFCGLLGATLALTLGQFVVENAASSILGTASGLFLGGRRGVIPDFHSAVVIAATCLVAVGMSLLGAIIPVYRLATNSVGAQRSVSNAGAELRRVITVFLSLIIIADLFWMLAARFNSKALALSCAIVAILAVAAVAYCCIGIATSFVSKLAKTSKRPAIVAGAGLFATGRVTLSRAAAVGAVSITLVISLSSMVDSFRASLQDWAAKAVSADVVARAILRGAATTTPALDESVITELKAVANVACIDERTHSLQQGEVKFVGITARCVPQQLLAGRMFSANNEALVSEASATLLGIEVGQHVTAKGGLQLLVVGIVKDFSPEGPQVLVALEEFYRVTGEPAQIAVVALYSDNSRANVASADVNRALKGRGLALDGTELRRLMLSTFDETFLITRFMRWCVLLLAVITIVVLFGQWLAEAASQRGVFKLLGASVIERFVAVLCGAIGFGCSVCVVGLVGGYVSAIILVKLVNPISFGWSFPLIFNFWNFFRLAILEIGAGIVLGTLGRNAELPMQRVEESLR